MKESPIFILGNPRSGTSLFRSLLNSHANVVIPPECGFMQWLYPSYKNFKMENLSDFMDDLYKCNKIEGWKMDRELLELYLTKYKPQSYAELCSNVYEFYGQQCEKDVKIWGDKNNYYTDHLPLLFSLYPKAKFIHLIRNPKDVVCSYLRVLELPDVPYKPKFTSNILEIVDEWVYNNNTVKEFLSKPNVHSFNLTYEDLILNTSFSLQHVCDYLEIENEGIQNNFNDKVFFDEPSITMKWKEKLKGPIDATNLNKYTTQLSVQECTKIDDHIFSKNINFDYYGSRSI